MILFIYLSFFVNITAVIHNNNRVLLNTAKNTREQIH